MKLIDNYCFLERKKTGQGFPAIGKTSFDICVNDRKTIMNLHTKKTGVISQIIVCDD